MSKVSDFWPFFCSSFVPARFLRKFRRCQPAKGAQNYWAPWRTRLGKKVKLRSSLPMTSFLGMSMIRKVSERFTCHDRSTPSLSTKISLRTLETFGGQSRKTKQLPRLEWAHYARFESESFLVESEGTVLAWFIGVSISQAWHWRWSSRTIVDERTLGITKRIQRVCISMLFRSCPSVVAQSKRKSVLVVSDPKEESKVEQKSHEKEEKLRSKNTKKNRAKIEQKSREKEEKLRSQHLKNTK